MINEINEKAPRTSYDVRGVMISIFDDIRVVNTQISHRGRDTRYGRLAGRGDRGSRHRGSLLLTTSAGRGERLSAPWYACQQERPLG